jgi:alpha-L-rhamnosidase
VSSAPLTPADLRCAYRVNPLGVAPGQVRLSWLLHGPGRDRVQTGYQVQVTAAEAGQAMESGPDWDRPAWDTGRVRSPVSAGVGYAGRDLRRGGRYAWRVRAWDEREAVSEWSQPAWFEVELDPLTGWRACWVGQGWQRAVPGPPAEEGPFDPVVRALQPAPYLRREFTVDRPVAAARLYATARGLYEMRLNGARVGDAVLAPGWTDYRQRLAYQTYDVTGLLRPGGNVVGAILADGWYSGFAGFDAKRAGQHYGTAPELLAQLVVRFAGGGETWVVTDPQWQVSSGAIRHADLLMGERHELALEPEGWDHPGYDARGWLSVVYGERDETPLVADPGPPVRVTQELPARSVSQDAAGRFIADFGQNLTGWLRLRLPAGRPGAACVRIRHGEVLDGGGGLYTGNLRTARQADEFVTAGAADGADRADGAGAADVVEPRFTLHGFRYAEITGYPGELSADAVTAQVVHSDIARSGAFESSAGWLNQLFANIDWGQRGNFISVPTDCPQRDERLGWLGDAQIFARTACYNRDVAAFFAKWLDDVADAQHPSGAFPDIAPRLNLDWAGAPAWGDAGVIIPWTLWKIYGDAGVLDRFYPAMTAWMEFIERGNPGYLRTRETGNAYNDWLAPGDDLTSPELLASAYWAHDAALMAEIAEATGRDADAAGYRALWSKIRGAFADAFVSASGEVASGTQTAYALALQMNLVPEELREAAAAGLRDALSRAGGKLTTGFVGVGYLLPVLSATGGLCEAYRLLGAREMPSWRYMIDQGATTVWERWDGFDAERGFQSAWMNSFNHYALGAVGEWLYRFVLGIEQAPESAGFGRLVVRPHPGGELTWARGSYESVRGRVASGWSLEDGVFRLRVSLPPNVTASVRVPSADPGAVRDAAGAGPSSVDEFPGRAGAREAVFEVGSGTHEFTGPALAADLDLDLAPALASEAAEASDG